MPNAYSPDLGASSQFLVRPTANQGTGGEVGEQSQRDNKTLDHPQISRPQMKHDAFSLC